MKINGVLLLDKATGVSSNRALQQAKRLLQADKAGHTGSLDPLASGVLPICFGEATKFSRFLLDADKTYLVTAKLGVTTDSGDSDGNILTSKPVPNFPLEHLQAKIATFIGLGQQVPSMYSALKHRGQPLYKLARKNITIERAPRPIHIYEFTLLEYTDDTIRCRVKCSKGTYIRSLIEDLGVALGCGAHVIMLRREAAGPFTLQHAYALESLSEMQDHTAVLLPIDCLLQGLPRIALNELDSESICCGRVVNLPVTNFTGPVQLLSANNTLLGIGDMQTDGKLVAMRLLANGT